MLVVNQNALRALVHLILVLRVQGNIDLQIILFANVMMGIMMTELMRTVLNVATLAKIVNQIHFALVIISTIFFL